MRRAPPPRSTTSLAVSGGLCQSNGIVLWGLLMSELSQSIRDELKQHDKFITTLCLECGYNGLMGVVKEKIPWYLSWWVLVPLLLTGSGILPVIGLMIWRLESTKTFVVSPSCKKTLVQRGLW